jgi:hypothetical protein
MSGNVIPSEDPRSWIIEGGERITTTNRTTNITTTATVWTVLDTQTDIIFADRHLTKDFLVTCRQVIHQHDILTTLSDVNVVDVDDMTWCSDLHRSHTVCIECV